MKLEQMKEKHYITVNGKEYEYHRINHDSNGNPRYVIHFLQLDIKLADYGKIKGLTKYKAKWFGGGYVFTSFNVKEDIAFLQETVNAYYNQ